MDKAKRQQKTIDVSKETSDYIDENIEVFQGLADIVSKYEMLNLGLYPLKDHPEMKQYAMMITTSKDLELKIGNILAEEMAEAGKEKIGGEEGLMKEIKLHQQNDEDQNAEAKRTMMKVIFRSGSLFAQLANTMRHFDITASEYQSIAGSDVTVYVVRGEFRQQLISKLLERLSHPAIQVMAQMMNVGLLDGEMLDAANKGDASEELQGLLQKAYQELSGSPAEASPERKSEGS